MPTQSTKAPKVKRFHLSVEIKDYDSITFELENKKGKIIAAINYTRNPPAMKQGTITISHQKDGLNAGIRSTVKL